MSKINMTSEQKQEQTRKDVKALFHKDEETNDPIRKAVKSLFHREKNIRYTDAARFILRNGRLRCFKRKQNRR